ncbi:MAG: hybrid sensor histidine kinase/response regulator [Acidimicrobiia bacterium]
MNRATPSWRVRGLSVAVLAVLLAGTFTATSALRNLVRDQNRQLLHERTAEAGLVLSSALSSATPSLELLGATYLADPHGTVANTLIDEDAAAAGNVIAIVARQGNQLVTRVAAGPGIRANQTLNGTRAALATRALKAKDLVSDLISQPGGKEAVLAFAVALPNGIVVYEEAKVDPAQLTASKQTSPFSELEGALYVGPSAQPSKLLFSTATRLPLRGTVDRQLLHIGADQWLLVTSARHALVGSFAATAPWIVFVLGLLISMLTFAAVDVVLRRRAHVLNLVAQRTAALRQSMDDLETARASAEAANQAKSEFLSRMSHELRTPLNAVLGFAQVLELGELTDAQQQSVVQITKGGQHLLELINDVLDISRIETGNLALSEEPVLVEDVVSDALELIEPLAAQRGIRCSSVASENSSVYVLADRQRLKQIVLNLLGNAVKYNRPDGTVTISYEHCGADRLRINVADTGPGIPADQRLRLFEPFERLGADQTNVEGAGIGLALSRRLAEAMNGHVDIDPSDGPGSTFWIELVRTESPVERHQRTTAKTPIARPEGVPDQPGHTVLYVEDNLANVKLIEHVLDYRPDIHLITAMQGRLGIDLAHQHLPELILLDLHLPDIGGETVLAELRAHPDTATTPIIVLTADATERQHARLIAAGATAYLTKPIDVRELLDLVDRNLTNPHTTSTMGEPTLTSQG